jgi:hypothetical protein
LKDFFRNNGFHPTRTEVFLIEGGTRSKGCGTARFGSAEEAERAIAECNGKTIGDRSVFIEMDKKFM